MFRHIDLIGQGQLWFGGLVTFSVFVIAVFASRFGYTFYLQYPVEKQQHLYTTIENSCKVKELMNAKFETALQLLSNPSQEYENIFKLLDSQTFIVRLDVLKTQFHCEQLRFVYMEKKIYLPFDCHQYGASIHISGILPAHKMTLNVLFCGNKTINSIRLGLTAKQLQMPQSTAQQLNFSFRFNYSDYRLTQNAHIDLELTKVINVTDGLAESDNTTFTGLWTSKYNFDNDQMFVNNRTTLVPQGDLWMVCDSYLTVLSLTIRETAFFVKNKQEPIARRSEIIFHSILFIGVCIDLLAMIFLLMKLWVVPIVKLFLKKLLCPHNWLYHFLFDSDHEHPKQKISEVVELEEKVATLELQLQNNNDRIEAFI